MNLIARGLTTVDRVNLIYDVDPAVGGPIKKDTLWFFGSVRFWKNGSEHRGDVLQPQPAGVARLHSGSAAGPPSRATATATRACASRGGSSTKHKISAQQQVQPADPRSFLRPGSGEPAARAGCDHQLQRAAVLSLAGGLDRAGHQPSAVRRWPVAGEQGLPLLPAAGGRPRSAVLDRGQYQHPLGKHGQRRRLQRQSQLERPARRVLRDRLARGEIRRQLPARELLLHDRNRARRPELFAAQRAAALGDALGDSHLALRHRQGEPRPVRAGSVDGEPADAQRRPALRLLQRVRAGTTSRPGPPGAHSRCRLRAGVRHPALEEPLATAGRRLRPLRQRQDRREGERRPVPAGR